MNTESEKDTPGLNVGAGRRRRARIFLLWYRLGEGIAEVRGL